MHHFRNPWWPVIATIIPVAVLCYVFQEAVGLVAQQLSDKQRIAWTFLGLACASVWLIHTVFTFWHVFRGRALDKTYGILTMGVYSLFLFLCCSGNSERIPDEIQGSVLGENRLFYAMACLSPTFVHAAVVLVLFPGQKFITANTAKFIVSCALFMIFVVRVLCPDLHTAAIYVADAVLALTFVALHYIVVQYTLQRLRKGSRWRVAIEYMFRLAGAVAYPLSGMLVNNDILFDLLFRTFAYPGFYLFSLVNGVVICLPEPDQRHWRMLLFMLRGVTFAFILIMQMLHLPLLPESTMALASLGLGYLMLAPIMLTIIKTKIILGDISFLKLRFSRKSVMVFSCCTVLAGLVVFVSLFTFEDEARALAALVFHALAFQS